MGAFQNLLIRPHRMLSQAAHGAAWLFVFVFLLTAGPLAAQDPAPRDTVPVQQDTAVVQIPPGEVVQDTVPAAVRPEPADTILPAPNLPVFGRVPAPGFSLAVWEWDQEALARWHGMSLLALLEQVPGLLATRGGWYGRPAGLAAFGAGGGRLRVILDGFELDPLESATLDVQHLPVVDLQSVRVERTLMDTRIELLSFRQPDRRAFSRIEAGTALFRTRILRGLFSTPVGGRSTITLGVDLTDTDGWLGQQPFSSNSLLGRWSYLLNDNTGFQLEYRQAALQRTGAPFAFEGDRGDLVFRARTLPAPGLAVDAVAGRSTRTPGAADTLQIDLESLQGALRARYDLRAGWVGGVARMRGGGRVAFAAPTLDLSADAGLRPTPWVLATGEVRNTRGGGVAGSELQGGVRLGPFAGVSVFASGATGTRGVGVFRDSVVEVTLPDPADPAQSIVRQDTAYFFPSVASQLRGFRAGAEWSGWGARLGAALVTHDVDSIAPFGLGFDRRLPALAVGPASGVEGFASVPLGFPQLRMEGSYVRWADTGGRPYMPADFGRIALAFNQQFYDGNLEPTLRVEVLRRGAALVPTAEVTSLGAVAAPYSMLNVFLQIRVLDVQAFLIWDNLTNQFLASDLAGPGRSLGGQRAIYGVRWFFFD